eukprot:4618363-Pleurochrysis_carterae.AAC.1
MARAPESAFVAMTAEVASQAPCFPGPGSAQGLTSRYFMQAKTIIGACSTGRAHELRRRYPYGMPVWQTRVAGNGVRRHDCRRCVLSEARGEGAETEGTGNATGGGKGGWDDGGAEMRVEGQTAEAAAEAAAEGAVEAATAAAEEAATMVEEGAAAEEAKRAQAKAEEAEKKPKKEAEAVQEAAAVEEVEEEAASAASVVGAERTDSSVSRVFTEWMHASTPSTASPRAMSLR